MKNKEPKQNEEAVENKEASTAPEKEEADELTKLKEELLANEEKYMRLLAEYDNFRKRTQREKDALWADATAAAVTNFLPVLDNFERSAEYETTDTAYKKGIDLIGASFKEALEKMDVKEIPAEGEKFDPNFHNAVMHTEDENVEENTVTKCFQKGYMIGERIIRHSCVQVTN